MDGMGILSNIDIYFLIFARVITLVFTAPLISSEGIPAIAKIGLTLFVSIAVYPWVVGLGYTNPPSGLAYVALIIGESLIGFSIGFFLQIVYAGFQTAGQFFSLQMGFSASEVFDPLSQEELPVLGQFFNLIAMFVFLIMNGMNRMFLVGVYGSFKALNAMDLTNAREQFVGYFVGGLGQLFREAMVLAMPILGTLFIVSIGMGLLAKAAPQLNLMSMGFPVNIMVAFGMLVLLLPLLLNSFTAIVDNSFETLASLFLEIGGQVPPVPAPGVSGGGLP